MVMNCCGGIPICTGLQGFGQNLLYPRRIDLYRSKDPSAPNVIGIGVYEGRSPSLEYSDPNGWTLLIHGIACNIIAHGIGRATGAMLLPGDVTKRPQWKISTVPMAVHTIRDRDLLIDDEGYRYQVALNGWTILGYVLDCIRLET